MTSNGSVEIKLTFDYYAVPIGHDTPYAVVYVLRCAPPIDESQTMRWSKILGIPCEMKKLYHV